MTYYSIRFKLTAILIFIVGFVIYFTWFLNNAFAESYYISSEKENIVSTFQRVKDVLQEASSQDTINEEMEQISNSTNIKMMIAQSSDFYFTQVVIFSNLRGWGEDVRGDPRLSGPDTPVRLFWEERRGFLMTIPAREDIFRGRIRRKIIW